MNSFKHALKFVHDGIGIVTLLLRSDDSLIMVDLKNEFYH